MDLQITQFDFDLDNYNDTLGVNPNSITYKERNYFETHIGNPGFSPVTIGGHTYHAAHRLIDYIRYWDVPADVQIPNYPH